MEPTARMLAEGYIGTEATVTSSEPTTPQRLAFVQIATGNDGDDHLVYGLTAMGQVFVNRGLASQYAWVRLPMTEVK